jgi:hypothetical protein
MHAVRLQCSATNLRVFIDWKRFQVIQVYASRVMALVVYLVTMFDATYK